MSARSIEFSRGDLIGQKYRLVRPLGEGGMASVWVAHNEALDIHVAVKFIRSDLQHPQLADRLLHEARAAARLGHPAIVRVTDFGKTRSGYPYIVMELLDGDDMRALLDQAGRIDAVQAVRTVLPVVDALATAHDKGIVHRDLKPENILLARSDGAIRPKLVDFGVAKFEQPDFKRLTEYGSALGSPGYMSPEQARGQDADARSDVWGMCVVIYELITGELPFDGESYNALLRAVIEDEPRPISAMAAGDAELWNILARGFEKDREKRWQTMRDLGAALASWLLARGFTDDIAERSLQSAWLQRRSSKPDDLLTTPTPSSRPGRASFPSLADLGTLPNLPAIVSAETQFPEQPSLNPVVTGPRRSRAPLFGLAFAVVVLVGGVLLWTARRESAPAPAASSLAAPEVSVAASPVSAAPPAQSAAAPAHTAAPAPSSVPSVTPLPTPVASPPPKRKSAPVKRATKHWKPQKPPAKPAATPPAKPASSSSGLRIKTTL